MAEAFRRYAGAATRATRCGLAPRPRRLLRFAAAVVTALLLIVASVEWAIVLSSALGHAGTVGLDYGIYRDRTRSWIAGDGFYLPRQLHGPYDVQPGDALYPPVVLVLLVPFTVMPAPLWWVLPVALLATGLWRCRPAWWAWPLIAAAAAYPRTIQAVLFGNPSIWAFALVAAGAAWGVLGPFVVLKPTLAPFALVGLRCPRAMLRGVAVVLLLGALFAPMWPDYSHVLLDARAGAGYGLAYTLGEWPTALALAVACWSGGASGTPPRSDN